MKNKLDFTALYDGFSKTNLLWSNSDVLGLSQFVTVHTNKGFENTTAHKKLRLGKWVEHLLIYDLRQQSDIRIITENLQIKNKNITIGELDVLFLKNEQPIHLEIIYKFYLYDESISSSDNLNNWIGPNRNDNLSYKLEKLMSKQLPLLHKKETKAALKQFKLNTVDIKQQVAFKAQLFLPYGNRTIKIAPLNSNCIVGWYLNYNYLDKLSDYLFYIPEKLEWLIVPNNSVDWLTFENAKEKILPSILRDRSLLCWVKTLDATIEKCFVTWW